MLGDRAVGDSRSLAKGACPRDLELMRLGSEAGIAGCGFDTAFDGIIVKVYEATTVDAAEMVMVTDVFCWELHELSPASHEVSHDFQPSEKCKGTVHGREVNSISLYDHPKFTSSQWSVF